MTIRTAHTETEKKFTIGISDKSSNETKTEIGSTKDSSPIGRVDLLDLLDEKFLPKFRVKNHEPRHVSILDVMSSPESVKGRIEQVRKKEVEKRKETSTNLLDLLDKRTYLPRKDTNENSTPSHRISILDVMNPPSSSPDVQAKKPMDLVNLLDAKTRLPCDCRGHSGCRRISVLDVIEKHRH
jgi:hypothetical protein